MLQSTLYNLRENVCAENSLKASSVIIYLQPKKHEQERLYTYADKPLIFKEIRRLIDCMPVSNNIKTTG